MAILTATIAATITASSVLLVGLENTYGRERYCELAAWVGAALLWANCKPCVSKFINNAYTM